MTQPLLLKAAIYSLAFLWIFTGLTSLFFSPEIGYQILTEANISGSFADVAIYSGGFLDILIGIWLLIPFKRKLCCIAQVTVIVTYTLLLTFIDIGFWLHPFGPVTKNIPIVVLIGYVYLSCLNSTSDNENKINGV
ncbi:DoxX-like family protein [Shewanella woodyi]|uniref:NAD-dependent epimerase/dehydratase n=1 Tax=Shewanella woodyi (strain ATCC 51908 / MS32) TaxID=392500 RepID=B1KF79_SHEWM|nr:DoxX-like family protein [Shewanella woodyi]ACA86620.1 NAD-dependent epimerase/dehydratase [Shewanella woodyi ATCC 51908]